MIYLWYYITFLTCTPAGFTIPTFLPPTTPLPPHTCTSVILTHTSNTSSAVFNAYKRAHPSLSHAGNKPSVITAVTPPSSAASPRPSPPLPQRKTTPHLVPAATRFSRRREESNPHEPLREATRSTHFFIVLRVGTFPLKKKKKKKKEKKKKRKSSGRLARNRERYTFHTFFSIACLYIPVKGTLYPVGQPGKKEH